VFKIETETTNEFITLEWNILIEMVTGNSNMQIDIGDYFSGFIAKFSLTCSAPRSKVLCSLCFKFQRPNFKDTFLVYISWV
jgi:hypothetical protein